MIVGGLLASISVYDNNIISRIPNYIPISSNIQYVVKKAREAAFMSIAGFVCNYPCRMSCDKGDCAGLGRIFKEIAFWYGEWVQ